jgi:hypothetical protein
MGFSPRTSENADSYYLSQDEHLSSMEIPPSCRSMTKPVRILSAVDRPSFRSPGVACQGRPGQPGSTPNSRTGETAKGRNGGKGSQALSLFSRFLEGGGCRHESRAVLRSNGGVRLRIMDNRGQIGADVFKGMTFCLTHYFNSDQTIG